VQPTSFTIGIGTPEVVRQRAVGAAEYRILKVKLGRDNDREIVRAIRQVTDKPIRVDVNGGWTDKHEALGMVEWLALQGVELIEQPMPGRMVDDLVWLRDRSPIPVFADEAVQRFADLDRARGVYDGINIKLMKCTGLHEARRMITRARSLGLKVMLGCMTETSCAISAAAQISPLADFIDLDGALLVSNDLFEGPRLVDGRVLPSGGSGIGVRRVERGTSGVA
jgi:L-alanine-DL-glutamate epimerase-like enolase superfamily enzyme